MRRKENTAICRRPLDLTDALHTSDLLPKMRIRFGTILSPPLMWQWNVLTIYHRRINNRSEKDENMVWTDSQDYGADEILSHPFALTPPVQRAACALHFEGSLQEPTEIIKLTNHPPTLFNISHSSERCVPLFSTRRRNRSNAKHHQFLYHFRVPFKSC